MGVIRNSPGYGRSAGIMQDLTSQMMQLQAAGVLGPTQITSQGIMDVLDRMLERRREKEAKKQRKEAQKKAEVGQWVGTGLDVATLGLLGLGGGGGFGGLLGGGGGGGGAPGLVRYY